MLAVNENRIKLTGIYRGIVLKHLPHGRCKIYIYGIYDEKYLLKPDMLPDAEQASPLFAGTNFGNGVFSYPNISSTVWCFFANNDQNQPVYFASTLGGENSFGQYEIVMPPRYEQGKQLSNIISTDVQSDKHLITSGYLQIELYESGKISAYVSDPQRRDANVDYNNSYQLQRQDDHVSYRPICEKIDKDEISNINCQFVLDNSINNGEISASTHQFADGNRWIDTKIQQNNNDNITLNTTCKDEGKQKRDGITNVNCNSTDNVGIHETSIDNIQKCQIIADKTSKNGKIEVKITDLDTGDFSRFYLDKKGNIFLESTASIAIKTKTMSIDVENQLDIKATSFNTIANVDAMIKSPAIHLNSKDGHTKIVSTTATKSF